MTSIPTTVIRHPKERISKCSLRFLHDRPEMTFLRSGPGRTFDATGYILLEVDAPPLSTEDADHPLLLLDSTWRLLPKVRGMVIGTPIPRSIPGQVVTAYPRVSRLAEDPTGGLASVEALYLARRIMGDNDPTLLTGYHWQEQFLENVAAAGL